VAVLLERIVCDEMVDPLIDQKLGVEVLRPEPSESDHEVLKLSRRNDAPILTRDRDFVEKHRNREEHHGIIFDPGMHHRPTDQVIEALESVFELMDREDLENTVVRLKRFY